MNDQFENIYREYSKPMFFYALSYLTLEEEAEDVVQEIFINLWKDGTFRKIHKDALKTYLFRSVKNTCLNRMKKRTVISDRLDVLRGEVVENEVMLLNDALVEEIIAEIGRLPRQTQEAIRNVYFRSMKYQEAAEAQGVSLNTIKTLLKVGMQHLRERFADRWDLFLSVLVTKSETYLKKTYLKN